MSGLGPVRKPAAAVLLALTVVIGVAASIGQWSGGTRMAAGFFDDRITAALESAIVTDDAMAIAAALAAGAAVNARGRHGVTPLMIAVDRQKQRAAARLLEAGADPNLGAADGASPVSLAVENHRSGPGILSLLMHAGGNPDLRRPDREPVIIRFVNDRDCNGIRAWKRYGADLDITTRAGDPIITAAALRQDWDVVRCLIELGARYDYENSSRQPISWSLAGPFPADDSPIFAFKVLVREFLKSKGIAVPPLEPTHL